MGGCAAGLFSHFRDFPEIFRLDFAELARNFLVKRKIHKGPKLDISGYAPKLSFAGVWILEKKCIKHPFKQRLNFPFVSRSLSSLLLSLSHLPKMLMNWDLPERGAGAAQISTSNRTVGNIDLQMLDYREKNKKLVALIRHELDAACNVQDYLEAQEELFEDESVEDISSEQNIEAELDEMKSNLDSSAHSHESLPNDKKGMKVKPGLDDTYKPSIKAQVIQNLDEDVIDAAVLSPTSMLQRIKIAQKRESDEKEHASLVKKKREQEEYERLQDRQRKVAAQEQNAHPSGAKSVKKGRFQRPRQAKR